MTAASEPHDLHPTHDIAFQTADVFSAIAAFGDAMHTCGGQLRGLSIASAAGSHAVRARIEGIAPEEARSLTDTLAARTDVSHVAVEHVIWRKQS
jgi:hypothetical protein